MIKRTDLDYAGVVDQDVDFSESIDNRPDSGLNLSAIEQIAVDSQNFPTARGEIGFRAREFFMVACYESDTPASRTNVACQHETEPAGSATDENNFIAQLVSGRANGATGYPCDD